MEEGVAGLARAAARGAEARFPPTLPCFPPTLPHRANGDVDLQRVVLEAHQGKRHLAAEREPRVDWDIELAHDRGMLDCSTLNR
jgi:hypothetical protein